MDIGAHEAMNISHYYDNKGNNTFDHFHTTILGTLQAKLRHYQKKQILSLFEFKHWGPPYYKIKKSFPGGDQIPKDSAPSLHPMKKLA
jgi:hypothetical protein